ncbi:alpha-L-arabinofuranosidase B [Auriculariales sp. MPI-PUGE-AT-0066]|nr:alpha-L-arabinofuranosidase B [Auriculariales sp. MPI-PUGE-AT-0066]
MVLKRLTALVFAACVVQAVYIPKTPPLTTPWTAQVPTAGVPLPEYPRPQLVRSDWQNLNGQWQFASSAQITSPPTGQTLNETILVPFPLESALSGIMRHENNMFYRRTFTIPAAWSGKNVQLNFGAVNWRSTVWINGKSAGTHSGAYDSFSYDITSFLNGATNEIIVGVYSPVDATGIPIGKQRLNPDGIFYTAASGIWQTVWLEPTNAAHVTRLDPTPDVANGIVRLAVQSTGASGQTLNAVVSTGGSAVATVNATVGTVLSISIPNARLWSPDDPFLYDLRVTLSSGDVVTGYFGMRTVGTAFVNGWLRPVLNGRFIMQMGVLDQGYWPDGIYTAPTDAGLRFDLERQKALGFNVVRKHIKVEPARWFYHADTLGLAVYQDMPAMRTGFDPSTSDRTNFEDELRRVVDQLRGITSIIQWIPFNEGWGEYDEARIATLTKSFDGTRLVNGNSGSSCCGRDPGNGDIVDDHIYVGPGLTNKPSASRVAQLGEFGGLGLRIAGHEYKAGAGFSYEIVADTTALTRRYVEVTDTLKGLVWSHGLSSSIYTEPTDVENEVNGYYTYDRQVFKPSSFDQIKAAHLAVQNSVAWLRAGESISLGVTTSGFTDRYVRHSDSLGITSTISDNLSRQDTTFRVRAGLSDGTCWSFESRNYPGRYLRHQNSRVRLDSSDGTALFNSDATFCLRTGKTSQGVSFEAIGQAGKFLRHINGTVYIASNGGSNAWDSATSWAADVTWQVASPWWRSGADFSLGSRASLGVTTTGLTTRYIRHQAGQAITSEVTSASDSTTKNDATFTLRAGLADPSCVSFESVNYPGQYLKHSSFRLVLATPDGGEVNNMDATFCAQVGSSGTGVSFWSYNIAGHAIRHINSEVWVATNGGPKVTDNAASYAADVSFRLDAPWAA